MKNRENVMCWLWPAIGLISLASALLGSGHAGAESLPLPQGEEVAPPWRAMLSLGDSEAKPQQAARFRIVDDAKNGGALVVGPWLAGNWFARAQYEKDYPPRPVEVCGLYRTVNLIPYTAMVRADFFDAEGKQLTRTAYPLLPVADWTAFSVRFDTQEELDGVLRDGYVLKVADGRGAVCGNRDLGTLYGAYGLLRQLGVRFYAEDCEVVPRLQELTIPEGTSRCGPRFGLRGFYSLYRYFGIEPSMKLGHTPHDDHGNFSGPDNKDPSGHTSHFLVPYGTYGESHPVVVIQNDW